ETRPLGSATTAPTTLTTTQPATAHPRWVHRQATVSLGGGRLRGRRLARRELQGRFHALLPPLAIENPASCASSGFASQSTYFRPSVRSVYVYPAYKSATSSYVHSAVHAMILGPRVWEPAMFHLVT